MEYFPYLEDELELQDVNRALADEKDRYLDSRKYLDRNKWLNAYNNLMSRGLTGVQLKNGNYQIQHNGLNFEDPEGYYGDVAYFINDTLRSLKPRVKEEEQKKELKLFDNSEFNNSFKQSLINTQFGGNQESYQSGWNKLDTSDKYGISKTDERRKRLIKALTDYRNQLKYDTYKYEGGPFKNALDLQTRLDAAIAALKTGDPNDDIDKLNELGLNASAWLNTGADNLVTLTDGTQITASQWRDLDLKQNTPQKWQFFKFYTNGEYYDRFIQAEKNGILRNLTKEELARFGEAYQNNPTRLKKIEGQGNIYWDSIGRRVIQPSMKGVMENLNKNSKVTQNEQPYQNNPEDKTKINMNTPLSQMNGQWSPEMKKEIEALGWDIASIIDPEAFSGSALALYASHLRDEANPNRSTLEKWLDRGTAALGGIQGFGDLLVTGKLGYKLYQLGKSIGSVTKFAGMLGASFGAIGAYQAKDSIMKLSNPESLTPQDLENIAYGFMGLIGLKSFAKARNKQTVGKQANPTIAEHNITINDKNGTHVIKVDETTAKEINNSYKFGRNNKTKSDTKTFNHEKVKKAVEEYNKNPENTKKIDLESASVQSSSKFGVTTEKPVKTKYVKNPNVPEYVPVGTKWYSPFGYMAQGNNKWGYYLGGGWQRKAWENTAPEQSSKGLWQRAKEFWSPEPKLIQPKSVETPGNSQPRTQQVRADYNQRQQATPYSNRGARKEYLNTIKKHKFSNNQTQEGDFDFKLGNGDQVGFNVKKNSDGSFTISTSNMGSKVGNSKQTGSSQRVEASKVKEHFAKEIEQITKNSNNTTKHKEMARVIRELKAKGWLKQGGTINNIDKQIEEFLKQNKI